MEEKCAKYSTLEEKCAKYTFLTELWNASQWTCDNNIPRKTNSMEGFTTQYKAQL